MPSLLPIAFANASPKAIPVSSMVWCSSICRSPFSHYLQINTAMTGDLVQHVVKEIKSRLNVCFPCSIKINFDGYFSFIGFAFMRNHAVPALSMV